MTESISCSRCGEPFNSDKNIKAEIDFLLDELKTGGANNPESGVPLFIIIAGTDGVYTVFSDDFKLNNRIVDKMILKAAETIKDDFMEDE